jgi:WS/DGAT/MGAT family acyltransferase
MDRLTGQDLITLWPEDAGCPQDVGALALLDGEPLLDERGDVRLGAVRAAVAARLHLVPRFRQVILEPRRGLGRPVWVDSRSFDVAQHVRLAPPAALHDESALLRAVDALRRRPLDRSRPMWEMWLLPGLPGGTVALYVRVHHVVADGPAAVRMLATLLDTRPDPARAPPPPAWQPQPAPSVAQLRADARARRRAAAAALLARLARRPARPAGEVAPGPGRRWGGRRPGRLPGRPEPRTDLTGPIGPDRTFVLLRADLDAVRLAARRHGATVNDVLLGAVTTGLRRLLQARGQPVSGRVLRAMVPVSLRAGSPADERGNVIGSMLAPLPVAAPDAATAVRLVAARTAGLRGRTPPRRVPVLRSRCLRRAALAALARQRVYTTYVANVRGPERRLYLAGAPLREIFALVPLLGNLRLGVGALSYAGRLTVAVVADRASVPDVDSFVLGLRDGLGELVGRAPGPAG